MSKGVKRSGKRDGRARAPRPPMGEVVRSALADDVLRMLSHEPGARSMRPEDVHQMRTSVRRLRSDLRFFGPAMDPATSRRLRDELKWLAGILGAARDLDVLEHRLREAAVALEVVPKTDALFEELARRRDAARSNLTGALDGDRYAALRGAVIAEARSPSHPDDGDRPAGPALVDRLAKDWRTLVEHVRDTPADAPSAALHELRKRSKRTRYAADSASSWPGDRDARRVARRSKRLQEALGILQDAAVAAAFVEDVGARLPGDGPARAAADALVDRERREAEAARQAYGAIRERMIGD